MVKQNNKIYTNDDCVGCNLCIANCPCEDANVAVLEDGRNKIYIDPDKCIVCGNCIRNCTHGARDYIDDTERLFSDLRSGKEISIIVAPSIRTNFDDFDRLLGYLRQAGAKAVYDTSFGADICTWAYLRHLQRTGESGMISQPCPSIVNFIERYAHNLLPQLAPVHSPAMCMAIYMRNYLQISGSYAFLSPCIAKRDEFSDANTNGLIRYNVTFRKLADYLKRTQIDWQSYAPSHFDNQQHGLGALYPMPGGLRENVLHHTPDAWVYQTEGQPYACEFLKAYDKSDKAEVPLLIDILNCRHGCNIGTGAVRTEADAIQVAKATRAVVQQTRKAYIGLRRTRQPGHLRRFDRELRPEDFTRNYQAREVTTTTISAAAVNQAFMALLKEREEERHIDCRSCGHASCTRMAEAIAKGNNHVENCVEYIKKLIGQERERVEKMLAEREAQAGLLREGVESILNALESTTQHTDKTRSDIRQITEQIHQINDISSQLAKQVSTLRSEISRYDIMSDEIISLSRQSVILSLNAAIEAAHAGDIGRGFSAVATQMKSLSNMIQQSAKHAQESRQVVTPVLHQVSTVSDEVLTESKAISGRVQSITRAVDEILSIQQSIAASSEKIANGG